MPVAYLSSIRQRGMEYRRFIAQQHRRCGNPFVEHWSKPLRRIPDLYVWPKAQKGHMFHPVNELMETHRDICCWRFGSFLAVKRMSLFNLSTLFLRLCFVCPRLPSFAQQNGLFQQVPLVFSWIFFVRRFGNHPTTSKNMQIRYCGLIDDCKRCTRTSFLCGFGHQLPTKNEDPETTPPQRNPDALLRAQCAKQKSSAKWTV